MLLGMMLMTMMARTRQQGWMPDDEGGESVFQLVMGGTEDHAVAPPFLFTPVTYQALDQRGYTTHDRGEGIHEE